MAKVRGKGRVIDRDKGWRELKRRITAASKAHGPYVAVGILQNEARKAKASRSKKIAAVTLLDVAHWNEFGTSKIPQRSFIRATVDGLASKYVNLQRNLARSIVKNKRTVQQALTLLGTVVQADIRKRISTGIPPPNADSTIARKGSSKPLIDTGQLRGSINFEVRKT